MADNDDLLDYEEEENAEQTTAAETAEGSAVSKKEVKGTYVSIHSSGFRDFLLKPEILRAIIDCGFEHPSEGMSFNQYTITYLMFNVSVMRIVRLHSRFPLNLYVGVAVSENCVRIIFDELLNRKF